MSNDSSKSKIHRIGQWAADQLDPSRKQKKIDTVQVGLKSLKYGPLAAIAVTAGSFILASLGAGVLISLYPAMKNWSVDQTNAWLSESVWAQFFFYLMTGAITAICLYYFMRSRSQKIAQLGAKKPSWRDLKYASVAFPVYFALLIVATIFVASFIPAVDVQQQQELGFNAVSGFNLFLVFIALVVLPPLLEEFLFRGVLFTGLRKKISFLWTTVIVSVIFGSLHLSASSDGPLWIAAIDTMILSYVLCYIREKTGSIWAGIGVHFLKNCIAFIGLFIIGS